MLAQRRNETLINGENERRTTETKEEKKIVGAEKTTEAKEV